MPAAQATRLRALAQRTSISLPGSIPAPTRPAAPPVSRGVSSALHVQGTSPHSSLSSAATTQIQEGVNLLADGLLTGANRTVTVLAGTYIELVAMDRSGKLLGAQAGVDREPGVLGAETIISNGEGGRPSPRRQRYRRRIHAHRGDHRSQCRSRRAGSGNLD